MTPGGGVGGWGGCLSSLAALSTRARKGKAVKQPRRSGQTTGGRHLGKPGNRPTEGKSEIWHEQATQCPRVMLVQLKHTDRRQEY